MKKAEEFKIFSETDLEREFDSISSPLFDTSNFHIEADWNLRITSLKRMQALISSDYIAFSNFPTLFLKFISPLSIQLQDLRSAVVKEAGATAVLAAQVLGDSFDLCAERLSDGLYKLISSGNKILSEAGSECYLEIIRSVVTWRLVPKSLEQFSSKNVTIRIKSCLFLQTMLEIYPFEVFEYAANTKSGFLDKIEQGLKLAVHDASSETRSLARKAFLAYSGHFPPRASRLFQSFDSSIQRAFSELTESKFQNTPARSTSANSSRAMASTVKIEPKSVEKKPRTSYEPIGTGNTTPETRPPSIKEAKSVIEKGVKEEVSLEAAIISTNDQNWSVRISSFEVIKRKVVEDSCARAINGGKGVWESLISTHLEHMLDANPKVVCADLMSLYVVTDNYPEKISLELEKILIKLLGNLCDSKEIISTTAAQLLDLIIDIYIPEDLLALFLKYNLQEVKHQDYLKFIEVVFNLASSSTEFFTMNGNVKSYLNKLMLILREIPRSHNEIILPAFEVALEKNRAASVVVVKECSPRDLEAFRGLLVENSSRFEPLFREIVKEKPVESKGFVGESKRSAEEAKGFGGDSGKGAVESAKQVAAVLEVVRGYEEVKITIDKPHVEQKPASKPQEVQGTLERPKEIQRPPEKAEELQKTAEIPQKPLEKPHEVQRPPERSQLPQSLPDKPQEYPKSLNKPQEFQKPIYKPQDIQKLPERPAEIQKAAEKPKELPDKKPEAQRFSYPQELPNSLQKPLDSLRPQEIRSQPVISIQKEIPREEKKSPVVVAPSKAIPPSNNKPQDPSPTQHTSPSISKSITTSIPKPDSTALSPASREALLQRFITLNDQSDPQSSAFESSMPEILSILHQTSQDTSTCELTIQSLQSIIQKRRPLCESHLPECLQILCQGLSQDLRSLQQLTEEVTDSLFKGLDPLISTPLLTQTIHSLEPPALQALIRVLTRILSSASPACILELMPSLMTQLKDSLNHSSADVRKTVVFCLVEIQGMIPQEFSGYLTELTPSQQKLVTIYIQRRLSS